MAQLPGRVSSAALLLENSADELLIVKAGYKDHWTVPGGLIEEVNELPLEAAIRETHEEVGATIDPKTVQFVAVTVRTSPKLVTYQFIFKAPWPGGEVQLQANEIDDFAWVNREQVAANDRYYGEVISIWAHNRTGYLEQKLEESAE